MRRVRPDKNFAYMLIRKWHDITHHDEYFFEKINDRKVAYHLQSPHVYECSCGVELGRYHHVDGNWWKAFVQAECRKSGYPIGTHWPPL